MFYTIYITLPTMRKDLISYVIIDSSCFGHARLYGQCMVSNALSCSLRVGQLLPPRTLRTLCKEATTKIKRSESASIMQLRQYQQETIVDCIVPQTSLTTYRHVKLYELSVIPFSYTRSHPDTIMIVPRHTNIAFGTMNTVGWLPHLASIAESILSRSFGGFVPWYFLV